ncbi:MAG: zinc ribbon domain-containing protein, partial [Candidatus Omnitrophica bacterium]|nr:zinc ribbon domain-containing protein [Candidatus Omnitrophota bacterium]
MPRYEYLCLDCHNKFDVKATLAEKERGLKPECPKCHSKNTAQVFSNFMVMGGSKSENSNVGGGVRPGCGYGG